MGYLPLNSRYTTAALDTTGLNPGKYTNAFTTGVLGINVPYFECFHMVITNAPAGQSADVFIGARQWGFTQPSNLGSEWAPPNGMLLTPSQEIYLLWDYGYTSAAGSVTGPTTTETLVQATVQPGTYTVAWSVEIGGTPGGAEASNFALYNGYSFVKESINRSAVGTYVQVPQTFTVSSSAPFISIRTGGVSPTPTAIYTGILPSVATLPFPVVTAWFRFDTSIPANAQLMGS